MSKIKNLIFTNARIFLGEPAIILENHFLITKNDLIEKFDKMENFILNQYNPLEYEVIDCQNLLICPGLIDVHVHFRDPGFKNKEDINSGSNSAIAGGFTTVVCQPNTNPTMDNPMVISYLNEQITKHAKTNIKFYSAATKNLAGKEMVSVQSMHKSGAVGFTDDGQPIYNAKIMKTMLQYSAQLNVVIAQHAEDHDLSCGGCVHKGRFAEKFNLKSIDPASEYSVIARDLALLEEIPKARYHILHVSCAKSLEYIAIAKNKKLKVTAEVTPHHFLITDEILFEQGSLAKMNPPLRTEKDIQKIIEGMRDGIIDIIASDHAPHDDDSKQNPISCASFGIIGLETMLGLSLELYHKKLISLERILQMLTYNPACLINEDNCRGIIKSGYKADLAIIDENEMWQIDRFKLTSKSTNTPFNGKIVKGRNIATIINGKIVYNLDLFN